MLHRISLQDLARREREQVEWKENVADVDNVVGTLSAFANDLQNLGGGYVVCGARETRDEHDFPALVRTGLDAARLRELEGKVMTRCRERVSPAIAPLVEQLPADAEDRRILVFIQPATGQAHTFRDRDDAGKIWIRVNDRTIEARNGLLRELLVRKGSLEPWDRRPCGHATVDDIDLLALRDVLQQIHMFTPDQGVEPYLSADHQISPFIPPLFVREPLTDVLRPRNFAVLMFGRAVQRFIPGAVSMFSVYPGTDRSDPHAERRELAGTLIEQARRLAEQLDVQSYTAFDKTDAIAPNALKYPQRALYEAMGNALAHRDYESPDPTRVTVFADRIEILSPGSLPLGMDPVAFREGRSGPKWRNQTLAWFFNRLQIAQAEGQGIPTILRVMREVGCPPPTLDADSIRVLCVLPAHPRHALLRELRVAEQALALGELRQAQQQVGRVLARDPFNARALQLFAEVQQSLHDPEPVAAFVTEHIERLVTLSAVVLVMLAEALDQGEDTLEPHRALARRLLAAASRGRLEEREVRRVVVAMLRTDDPQAANDLLARLLGDRPDWQQSASIRQLRGDTWINLAKRCRRTGQNHSLPHATRQRAWQGFRKYLDDAERELREALTLSLDASLTDQIQRNLAFIDNIRRTNQPRR